MKKSEYSPINTIAPKLSAFKMFTLFPFIVANVSAVSNSLDRQKARDVDAVIDDLVALAKSFEGKAWIFEAAFTIDELKKAGAVVIRPGAIGFDNTLSIILSGEGGILDTVTQFDTSVAVLTS